MLRMRVCSHVRGTGRGLPVVAEGMALVSPRDDERDKAAFSLGGCGGVSPFLPVFVSVFMSLYALEACVCCF